MPYLIFFLSVKKMAASIFSYWRSVWISECKATELLIFKKIALLDVVGSILLYS